MYFEFWRAANSKSKTGPNAAMKLLSESLLSKRVKIFEIQAHAPTSASLSIIRDTCSQAKRLKLDSKKVERCELEMNKNKSCAEPRERRRKKTILILMNNFIMRNVLQHSLGVLFFFLCREIQMSFFHINTMKFFGTGTGARADREASRMKQFRNFSFRSKEKSSDSFCSISPYRRKQWTLWRREKLLV